MNTAIAGTIVNRRYRIAKPLGQGAYGAVYLAEDLSHEARPVALKVLLPRAGQTAEIEHFRNEFQFLAQLRHPNLAEVYDFGMSRDLPEGSGATEAPFFTMEYVRGDDFYIATAGMSWADLYELIVQVCRGLEFIHSRGFVHHDVKPGNLLVTTLAAREEGGPRFGVKLLDFGLAAHRGFPTESTPRGTVPYMAPEMFKGLPVDRRADLYSLGVVLYQVICRRLPFEGDVPLVIVRKHLQDDPVALHLHRKDVPRPLESLVLRLLAKEPADRLPSANMVIQTLSMLTGGKFEIETRTTRESWIMGGRFVGREAPFLMLRDALDTLVVRMAGAGRVAASPAPDPARLLARFKNCLLLSGERGIGKQRLVQEFKQQVQLSGVAFADLECPADGAAAFAPFLELLRHGLHVLQGDDVLFDRYADELALLLPDVAGRKRRQGLELEPERERVRLVGRVADLVLEMAHRQPTVICIRNLHWIDPMSQELVRHLAHRLHALRREHLDTPAAADEEEGEPLPRLAEPPGRLPPLLLVATYDDAQIEGRPQNRLVAELTASGSAEEIRLRRLTLGEISDLVKSMLGLQLLPESLARLVHENSGGNPLFAEELMKAMVEEGVIAYDRCAWRVYEDRLRAFSVPPGMTLLLQRRLERAKGKDLQVLELVSAFHRAVPLEVLGRWSGDSSDTAHRVGWLERRGLLQRAVTAGQEAYGFAHAAMRDLVYQGMSPERRREIHDRIGADLTDAPEGGRARGDPDECAFHLQRGRQPARALPWLLAAADRARARHAIARALEGYEAALALIPAEDRTTREPVLEKLAAACTLVGRYDDAVRAYSEVLAACRGSAPPERLISLCGRISDACAKKGDTERAVSFVAQGFQAAGAKLSPEVVRLHHQQGMLLVQRGQCREGIEVCEKGLDLAARLGDEALQGPLFNVMGVAHLHLGTYDRSKSFLERALEVFERHGDVHGQGNCLNNLAALYGYTGHHKKALEEQKRVLALREQTGDRWGVVLAIGNLGVIAHEMGDNDTAMEYFRRSLALREEVGMSHGVATILLNIGSIQLARGQVADAWRSWERCLSLYREHGDQQGEVICLTNLVNLYTYCGDLKRAEGELARARELAQKLQLRRELSVLQHAEAEIAAARGDVRAAERAFRVAEALYEEIRAGTDLGRTRLCLAQVLCRAGEVRAATEMLDRAQGTFEGTPPANLLALAGLVRGRLSAPADALDRYRAALAHVRGQDFPDLEWETHFAMARALETLGRNAEAILEDRRALEILQEVVDHVPGQYRDRFATIEPRRTAWIRFLRLQAAGALDENLDTFVIRLAVKGETMEHREETGEMDATRRRLQVAINLLKDENKNLVKLIEINKKVNSELDRQRLLEFILDAAVEMTRAEKGFLLLLDEKGAMGIKVARNFEKLAVDRPEQHVSGSIAQEVARTGKVVLTSDAAADSRFNVAESVRDLHLASVLCVPLRVREKILGALYIENRAARGFFTEKDRELLEAFSDQAAIAIGNAQLVVDLKSKQAELEKSKADVEALNAKLQEMNQRLEGKVIAQEEELTHVQEALVLERGAKYSYKNIVGNSAKMKEVFTLLDRVTTSKLPVVIHGESGTGKELVARAIHYNGPRQNKPFAAENCAAITETLLESELFGYMRGAFTGADKDRKGLFEVAHQGTLFLDEIGDMSMEMQKKLLRVLETGELRRVGGKDTVKVDVRIIAASNKDLFGLTKEALFREDLYYRLNVFQVKLPPLRERREDMPALIDHLLALFASESKTALKKVDPSAVALLRDYEWPGNVRELKNIITGVSSLTDDLLLTAKHFVEKLPMMDKTGGKEPAKPEYLSIEEYTRRFIVEHQDSMSDIEISDYLGISRKTLWEKRKKWGIAR